MSGEALPFPPAGEDSWMAWSGDGSVEIEVSRRGLALTYGKRTKLNGGPTAWRGACPRSETARYREVVTLAGWKRFLADMPAGALSPEARI